MPAASLVGQTLAEYWREIVEAIDGCRGFLALFRRNGFDLISGSPIASSLDCKDLDACGVIVDVVARQQISELV